LKTSIVMPVRNRVVLTEQSLGWLRRELRGRPETELIVVDDGSSDATGELLESLGGDVRTVRRPEGHGFAAACNVGAGVAAGQLIVFLNNDMSPVEGWLDRLRDHLTANEQAGAAGAKLLDSQSLVQHAGVVICQDGFPRHAYRGFPRNHFAVQRTRSVSAVTGACLAIRRDLFETLDGFDSKFVNGYEDIDLCLRLGELGHEVHYCHSSELHHYESATRGDPATTGAGPDPNAQLFRERWAGRAIPDDLATYLADGLIEIEYSDVFPLRMRLSPALALVQLSGADAELADLLDIRSRQVFDLLKENVALRVRLGELNLWGDPPDWLADSEPEDPFRPR
jgi:GT2 family glycosyltransferase